MRLALLFAVSSQLIACAVVSDQPDGAYAHLSGGAGEDATPDASVGADVSVPVSDAGPSTDASPADVAVDPACTLIGWSVGSSCAGGLGSAISDWEWKLPCGNPGGPGAPPDCSLCDDGSPWFDATPWPKATSCEWRFDYADAGREALLLQCHAPCP